MSSLALPPSPIRHRSSFTNVRAPLCLDSCSSRKRACSVSSVASLPQIQTDVPPQQPQDSVVTKSPRPMLDTSNMPGFISRSLKLFESSNHAQTPSTSYSEDSILPTSAPTSPTHSTFGDIHNEKLSSHSGFPSIHAPILLVIIMFPITTAAVLLSLASLPVSVWWPHTLNDLAQLGRELHDYSQSGNLPLAHVLGVMSVTAVWKHMWSIPGSVIWNVLAGALFHPAWATVLLTLLTTIGSVLASLLSRPMAPLLSAWFPKALAATRNALQGGDSVSNSTAQNKTAPWVRLSILRLIGVVPWSGINIACGVCGVALCDCFLGSFIGALPWTAVTCQIGDILQTVATTPSATPQSLSSLLTSPDIILKLVFLSFISLAPILGRERLRAWVSSPSSDAEPDMEKDERRFRWVSEWRTKIRMPSRSRSRRNSSDSEGEMLEKDTLP